MKTVRTSAEPEYDDATCITAGELRASGANVATDIPDCAWVRRSAMRLGQFKVDRSTLTTGADATIKGSIDLHLTEPFRWIECTIGFKPPDGEPMG